MSPAGELEVLPEPVWQERKSKHEQRVDLWLAPFLARAHRSERHPVEDFLFTYYSYRPAQLRRWTPGVGVTLVGARAADFRRQSSWISFDGGGVALAPPPEKVARTAAWIVELLDRTSARQPHLGCFGLHEWAMVHRQDQHEVRHPQWPLRLGPARTTAVVESLPVRCSHFDAFRFFTPSSRTLNSLQPTRETQLDHEQGGCLHANMDLYKWAYKLAPWVPSELVADCFDLARRVRALDMRASPYDLESLGYRPIKIETPEGRREYAERQRVFAAEAVDVRSRAATAAHRVASSLVH